MLFSLRLTFVLYRRRGAIQSPDLHVHHSEDELDEGGFEVEPSKNWVRQNLLVEYNLTREADEWQRIGRHYKVVCV